MTPWRNLGLLTRIVLIMTLLLIGFLAVSLVWQYRQHRAFVIAEATEKARIITTEANRTRDYVSQQLQIGQVVLTRDRYGLIPVVSASRIGQIVARDLGYTIRHTSLRYRNPANAPDDYERVILQRLESTPGLQSVAEVTTRDGVQVFRYLQAAHVDESCLVCHGRPDKSPEFLREIYPPERDQSYHYHIGQMIGAVSVVIPMTQLEAQLAARFRSTLITTAGIFLALVVSLGILVRTSVVGPLNALARSIDDITHTGYLSQHLPVRSQDEIGRLVTGFNEMMGELGKKTAQLEESEKRFRLLTEMARDAIVAFLPGGQVFLVNHQAERLFGYFQSELLGEAVDRLLVLDDAGSATLCTFLQTAESGWFGKTHRVTGLARGSVPIPLEMTVTIVDTGERPFYTAILYRTEQKV